MQILEYIKVHHCRIVIVSLTVIISIMISGLALRLIPGPPPEPPTSPDTIFVDSCGADSILRGIYQQVYEINKKIPTKSTGGKKRPRCKDTIRLDATIHVDNHNSNSVSK